MSAAAVLVEIAVKTSLVLGLAWLATAVMARRSAAARHVVWTLALTAALSMPVLVLIGPTWRVAALPDGWAPGLRTVVERLDHRPAGRRGGVAGHAVARQPRADGRGTGSSARCLQPRPATPAGAGDRLGSGRTGPARAGGPRLGRRRRLRPRHLDRRFDLRGLVDAPSDVTPRPGVVGVTRRRDGSHGRDRPASDC